jgi:hypothetical protein
MNPEILAKAKAQREANRALWDSQTITINAKWRIIRADEMNWIVQYMGKNDWQDRGFFGRLSSAFASLPDKMVGEEPFGSLADLIGVLNGVKRDVSDAFHAL